MTLRSGRYVRVTILSCTCVCVCVNVYVLVHPPENQQWSTPHPELDRHGIFANRFIIILSLSYCSLIVVSQVHFNGECRGGRFGIVA